MKFKDVKNSVGRNYMENVIGNFVNEYGLKFRTHYQVIIDILYIKKTIKLFLIHSRIAFFHINKVSRTG